MKRNIGRRFLAGFLAILLLVSSGFTSAQTAEAATIFSEKSMQDLIHEDYKWTMLYRKGITEAEPFGQFSTSAWRQYTNNGAMDHANNQVVALASENTPGSYGCWYRNVGQYTNKDNEQINVDFKITIMGVHGAEARYDMTKVRAEFNGETPPSNWDNNMVQPCITFWTNRIGVSIVAIDTIDVKFEYYNHDTGELIPEFEGHGTFADLDGMQQVTFGDDSNVDEVIRLKGSQHIYYEGNTAHSEDSSTTPSEEEGWLTWLFKNNTLNFNFGYPKVIDSWDQMDADTIAEKYGGDKDRFIQSVKNSYRDDNGTSYAEDYSGQPRYFEYAFFEFTSWVVGTFEPNTEHRKYVGDVGAEMNKGNGFHPQEDPYQIYGYEEFEYQTEYFTMPMEVSSFEIQDTLEDCLAIDGTHKVKITDNFGSDVTDDFTVKIEGQTITATAKSSVVTDDAFMNNRTYRMHLIVHRKEGADLHDWLLADGYTFQVPNQASVAFVRELDGKRFQYWSNETWIEGKVVADLQVDKFVDFEWEVGDTVEYTVKVFQKTPHAWAKNVVVSDLSLPSGLKLIDYTADWPSGAEHCKIDRVGENSWTASCPLLKYDESIIIKFRCEVTDEINGQEILNTATATADNFIDEKTEEPKEDSGSADLWTNTPKFTIDKSVNKYEWQVGDTVHYQVVVNNTVDYTVAKDVVISDLSLPEGLTLQGGDAIQILGLPDTIQYPKADGLTGMAYDTKQLETDLVSVDNTWQLGINYLPYNTPVTIVFDCVATEQVNGLETDNQASVSASNAETMWDDAEIYVNTAVFSIDKSADHYEWQVGEDIAYQVVVTNTFPGTIARDVVIWDDCLPDGLALNEGEDAIQVEGIPAAYYNKIAGTKDTASILNPENYNETEEVAIDWRMERNGDGWKLSISDLPCNTPVTITFHCQATQEMNGQESVNVANVQAENGELVQDDAEVYVNTAILTLDKSVTNPYLEANDNREANEFRVGETVEYTVVVNNQQPGSIARNLVITDDSLPEGLKLDPESFAISGVPETIVNPIGGTDDAGNQLDPDNYQETEEKAVTTAYEETATGWRYTISDLPYHTPVTITYTATAQETVNGNEIINTATAVADNAAPVKDSEKVWINSPVLNVSKEADKDEYKYGDIVTYEVEVTQDQIGCVARNVTISDVIETPGVKLQKNSIVLMDAARHVIEADVDVVDNTFVIQTGRNLVKEGNYSIWDASQGGWVEQSQWNPLGLETETKFYVEYQVAIVDHALAGQTVKNKVTVNSDENIPKEEEETIEVHAPELDIVKTSDKRTYHIGEKGYYQLTIRQIREDVTAFNVVITDSFSEPGMVIDPNSIAVLYNGSVVDDAVITAEDNHFTIATGKDLEDQDKLEVYYTVTFTEASLSGKTITNTATAKGDNTEEERQDHPVDVIDLLPRLAIEKTSDKTSYRVGETGHYTVTVTQTEKDAVARNVIIKDEIHEEAAQIVEGSLVIVNQNGVVMDQAEIQSSANRYTIFTGADLAYQETFTVTYDVLFTSDSLAGKDILNVARATADNIYVEPEEPADPVKITDTLTTLKSSVPESGTVVANGDPITYSIQVANADTTEKTVLIRDAIPAYTQFVPYEGEAAEGEIRGEVRTLEGKDYVTFVVPLQPGESKSVSFAVQVTDAPEDGMILNVAQVRTTIAKPEDMNEDTWTHEGFQNTNETKHYLDTRWVSDSNTVQIDSGLIEIEKTSDKLNYAVGDTGHYTLTVTQVKDGAVAENIVITDDLQSIGAYIQKDTIQVTDGEGLAIEGVDITAKDQSLVIETHQNLEYGQKILVTYDVFFQEESLENTSVKNVATAKDDSTEEGEEPKDENTVTVGDSGLLIEKTSDQSTYQVGEIAHYTLTVRAAADDFVAKNVTVHDVMKQKGANLIAGTVKAYLDGVRLDEVTITELTNSFDLETGIDLSGSHILTVTYDVTMEEEALAGRQIVNTATADADNTDAVDTDHHVTVDGSGGTPTPDPEDPKDPSETPEPEQEGKLVISKTSDRSSYTVGSSGMYTLQVKTSGEEAAKNVVVTDTIETSGVQIKEDSITVSINNQTLSDVSIQAEDNGFTIETHTDLEADDLMMITYEVTFKDNSLKGKTVKNIAIASSDNLGDATTDHSISIPTQSSGGTTTSGSSNTGASGTTFTSGVKTGDYSPVKLLVILGGIGVVGILVYFLGKKKGRRS